MSEAHHAVRVLHVTAGQRLVDVLSGLSTPKTDRIDVVATTREIDRRAGVDHAVDCVVVDHEPPAVDGLEHLNAIRENRPELPVVLRTDSGSEQLASDAISAGVSAYLHTSETATLVDRLVDLAETYQADRTQAEELERTADLLAQTEQTADVGGWEITPETREVFWTDHVYSLLGVETDTAPSLSDALDGYHPADRPIVESAIDSALNDGEPFDIEVRVRYGDGESGCLHVRGVPTVVDGRVETLRGTVQDVTERRTRERVLREMHDIIADREAGFDQQVRKLLELGRTELDTRYGTLSKVDGDAYTFEIVATDDDRVREGDTVPVSATNCETVATAERTVVLGDVERDAPEQTHRAGFTDWGIACYLGAPVFVDETVYGTVCFYDTEPRAGLFSEWERTLIDLMSQWVSYELQRQQTTNQLYEQNQQLDRFASIVSHDLRNPLSIVDGYVQQAIETDTVDHLSRAQSAIDRMDTLIDDVLLLSRSKDTLGDRSTVDLAGLVDDCWETVPTETATLSVTAEGTIYADKTRLKQLVENLFRNCVEHGSTRSRPEADDSVEHGSTDSRAEPGDGVTVTVGDLDDGFYIEDDGPGIPAADRGTVFEDGYSTAQDGTGLGLSIVSEIVDAHGWTVDIVEGADGGARFDITDVDRTE